MIYRAYFKGISLLSLIMLVYLGACLDLTAPPPNPLLPSGVLQPATVPGSSDPNQDEWPMFRGQLNHTGEAHTTTTLGAKPFWTYDTGSDVYSSPAVAGGRLYVGNDYNSFLCLNATTGGLFWNYHGGWGWSSPAVAMGRVFAGSYWDHTVYCLNATTGKQLWNYTTGEDVESSPAVAGGRVYIGSYDHYLYCLNATTGKQLWNYSTKWGVDSSPAVAGGRVYISEDDCVFCLNATIGKSLWNYTIGAPVDTSPVVANGRVYSGSRSRKVYCLNATTGESLWNYTTGEDVYSSPAVAGGRVYVGCMDAKVYCLNATTGKSLWNYTTGSWTESSPAVAGGRVYVGSTDKNLYCLNATTGGPLWNYSLTTEYFSSPAVAGGRVYFCSDEYLQQVYCLPTILDAFPPTYTVVHEDPFNPYLGDAETITITGVADPFGIQAVLIAFGRGPFEGNQTMTDLGGGTWCFTWTPRSTGIYPYTIYLQDVVGNWIIITGEFNVYEPNDIPAFTLSLILLVLILMAGFFILKRLSDW